MFIIPTLWDSPRLQAGEDVNLSWFRSGAVIAWLHARFTAFVSATGQRNADQPVPVPVGVREANPGSPGSNIVQFVECWMAEQDCMAVITHHFQIFTVHVVVNVFNGSVFVLVFFA